MTTAVPRKKLTFITDLAPTASGGGCYAVDWHTREELKKHFDLHTPPSVVPSVSPVEKFRSRLQRYLLKRPGDFFYFSPATLDGNARKVSAAVAGDADGIFFRSATRWCHCRPRVPYFIYLDAVFHTYFANTFDPRDFRAGDLQRIYAAEARFLEGAAAVFFESGWGLRRAREAYGLRGNHYLVTNRGGVIEPPGEDYWSDDEIYLLSIAMKFEQKGGDIILAAFRELKKRFPQLRWHVVGGRPTGEWQSVDGIVYEGVLNPENPEDLARFRRLLAGAFLLAHPTREDVNPLVISEAGYFGCPAVSVDRFAIPDLIRHGETGILLDWPPQPERLAAAVAELLEHRRRYREMRVAAREYALKHFLWENIGAQMAGVIHGILEKS